MIDRSPVALADLYAEIGHKLATHRLSDAYAAVSATAVEMLPAAVEAGITRARNIDGYRFDTLAATSEETRRVDQIQYQLGSGPCVDAATERAVFRTGDLSKDPRWPEFGRRAVAAAGVHSVLSVRLYLEGHADREQGAALNIYGKQRDAFSDDDQLVATLLASHAAIAFVAAAAREKVANLQVALATNRTIGVAIGVLMSHYKITEEAAFALLQVASQHLHRRIAELAPEVIETGALPLPDGRG
jgi:GAF domain-containing protein